MQVTAGVVTARVLGRDAMAQEAFAWFAGVDWGSERHHACIVDAQGIIAGEREFPHSGAGLAELGDWLLLIAGEASAVAVAIEVPHGPVVDSLIDRGFIEASSRLHSTCDQSQLGRLVRAQREQSTMTQP